MDYSIILSTISGIGFAVAYVDYNRHIKSGVTTPNGATWAIWSVIASVSLVSYFASSGDIWKSVLPLLNIVLCIGTFIIALIAGKFKRLDASNWIALGVGLIAVVIGVVYKSATHANLIVQVAIMIGFIPTWRSIRVNPASEHPRPWWIWSASYCIFLIVVIMRWKNQWTDLVYPINCIALHASVPVLCFIYHRAHGK